MKMKRHMKGLAVDLVENAVEESEEGWKERSFKDVYRKVLDKIIEEDAIKTVVEEVIVIAINDAVEIGE